MESFILNGKTINTHQLLNEDVNQSQLSDFEFDILTFVKSWLSGQNKFELQTSGSTGTPKAIECDRQQMEKSARRTLDVFALKPGSKVLSSLHPMFIAGKMMLVRAIVGELELEVVTPSSNPLSNLNHEASIDFAAFTPNQIEHVLNENPDKLNQVKTILIGGAGLHPILEAKLQNIESNVFHSYAMTEALTHVAIRKVNGPEKSNHFHGLKNVTFKLDKRSCLVINDEELGIKNLVSNDIVELIDETSFQWIGRYDNVINSGGIKIQIEAVEREIETVFQNMNIAYNFCVVSEPDAALTNKMILFIEGAKVDLIDQSILEAIREKLPKYHAPKDIIWVPGIILTKSGKIDRIGNTDAYIRNLKKM